jgi:chemotaxis protein MotB
MFWGSKKKEACNVPLPQALGSTTIGIPKLKQTAAAKISVVYNDSRARKLFEDHGESAAAGGHGDGDGTWIFSYADMITILMMFFILLLSISSMDVQKFEELKGAMATSSSKNVSGESAGNAGENAATTTSGTNPNGETSGARPRFLTEPGVGNVPFRLLAEKAAEFSASDKNAQLIAAIQTLMLAVDSAALSKGAKQTEVFEELRDKLSRMQGVVRDEASLGERKKQEIKISFLTKGLFNAKQQLNAKGRETFARLATSILALDPFPEVGVSAFVAAAEEPNYNRAIELSNIRAMSVFSTLEKNKVSSDLMTIAGYGQAKPHVAEKDQYGNTSAVAEQKNSRIEISIQRRKDFRK